MVMVLSAGAKELLIVGGKKKLFKKRRVTLSFFNCFV